MPKNINFSYFCQVVGELPLGQHPVQSMDVINGGRLIAVGGGGTTLKVARLG